MDFAQHVGQGHGQHWRGILFRRTYKQLDDVVAKTKEWFYCIFPTATYNKANFTWTFADGEQLLLRHFDSKDDYWNYHGHELPWIGWEELTNWPTLEGYLMMMSCCRSSHPGMPRKYRATANPYGVGHNVVKARFIEPDGIPTFYGTPINDKGQTRVYIHGTIWENKILLQNDPAYLQVLMAETDDVKRKAWLDGSWDIVAGGMFDDLWDPARHVVEPFTIPRGWKIDRCFDWGSSKPFAVLWCAESDGTVATYPNGDEVHAPKGTIFVFNEWYGWNGKPNEGCRMLAREIARGVKGHEEAWKLRVAPGPADSAIYTKEDGRSIAGEMENMGVKWTPSDKGPGSRVAGWEVMRQYLAAAKTRPMEDPGLLIFSTCPQLIRTLPSLPRDERKLDDVDTNAEDHLADALRYRLTTKRHSAGNAPVPWR
jgi:hypothetical protein